MLSARTLNCHRGARRILDDIDLDLHPGEVLGILGANGAGKTTLLGTLAGELPADGTLTLDGTPLAQWSAHALARRRAVLPQAPSLGFDLSVHEVVAMGAYPFPELGVGALDALMCRALDEADALVLGDRRYLSLSGENSNACSLHARWCRCWPARRPANIVCCFSTSRSRVSTPVISCCCCARCIA